MNYFAFDVVCQCSELLSEYEESSVISEIIGYIRHHRESKDEPRKIGKVRLYRLNVDAANDHGISLGQACNMHSEPLLKYYQVFFRHPTNELKPAIQDRFEVDSSDILIVDACVIAPKYRGRGLGLLAMRRCIDLFGGGCGLIVCLPCPARSAGGFTIPPQFVAESDSQDKAKGRAKLQKHWKKLGFQSVGRTGYYAFSTTHEHPSINDLIELLRKRR